MLVPYLLTTKKTSKMTKGLFFIAIMALCAQTIAYAQTPTEKEPFEDFKIEKVHFLTTTLSDGTTVTDTIVGVEHGELRWRTINPIWDTLFQETFVISVEMDGFLKTSRGATIPFTLRNAAQGSLHLQLHVATGAMVAMDLVKAKFGRPGEVIYEASNPRTWGRPENFTENGIYAIVRPTHIKFQILK